MDLLLGVLVAAVVIVLCVGFGIAVRTVVTGLLGGSSDDKREPTDRQ